MSSPSPASTTFLSSSSAMSTPSLAPVVTAAPFETKCDRYYESGYNKTYFIYGGYEGIPENLLINFIGWIVLLTLFSVLRKLAWDYGRIALVSRAEARWTSLFYGDHVSVNDLHASQESLDTQVHRQDKGFCSWIIAFFRIKDEHILQKSGRDAVQYLSFQRYLMVYLSGICAISIIVVLPVNFQGTLEGNTQQFGHTTISNINANSATLWLHSVLAVVFLIAAILFMRHFSVNLQCDEDEQATKTLMISHLPKDKCFKSIVQKHFQEAYPEAPAQDIQFAYNISKLVKLDQQRERAFEGRINSEAIYKQTSVRPVMVPYMCGQLCCCCQSCGCVPVDAITYYTEEENRLAELCELEKVNAFRDVLGMCFVTFEDDHVAARVHMDFRITCKAASSHHTSSVSRELEIHNWEVKYAPTADNINWENLSISYSVWWIKAVIINIILFVILFFLTTPSIFLNLLNAANYRKAMAELHNPLMVQFLPTLLLWAISAILPNIVYYSDQFIGHWTRSAEHHAVMRKTFIFLLLMVIILPSLGLTSAKAMFEWFATQSEAAYKFRWQCIFLPDNGAFFVNYVVTSALIGTAAELIRFPELFMYALKLLLARSAAERTAVRKSVLWEFQFGIQYAWMMCIFSLVMAYSLACPLIVPFGLLYLVMKHMVDRYNIYFAYGPSKIDKNIHASAINFVIIAVILLQFVIVFFTILRTEVDKLLGLTVFSMVALFITLTIFFGRLCFGWFKGLSPITYRQLYTPDENRQAATEPKPFMPKVLMEKPVEEENNDVHASYGSTETPTPVATPDGVQPDLVTSTEYTTKDETQRPAESVYRPQSYFGGQ